MQIDIDSSKDLSHFNEYHLVTFSKAIIKIFPINLLEKKILYTKIFFLNFVQNLLNLNSQKFTKTKFFTKY